MGITERKSWESGCYDTRIIPHLLTLVQFSWDLPGLISSPMLTGGTITRAESNDRSTRSPLLLIKG